jgi:hypothetical protein
MEARRKELEEEAEADMLAETRELAAQLAAKTASEVRVREDTS